MLHKILADYLEKIEKALETLSNCYFEKYDEEFLTANRANIRVRIRFSNGYLLELNEAVVIQNEKLTHLSYRYHFQNHKNELIFRYDNTPHFPNLKTFPHHKHLPDDVVESSKASIINVIEEAFRLL